MGYLWYLLAFPLLMVIHELGHWLTARYHGFRIKFWFEWGYIWGWRIVPRGLWKMPHAHPNVQRDIALSGFALEFFMVVPFVVQGVFFENWFGAVYTFGALAHFFAYPYYAGSSNDWYWI